MGDLSKQQIDEFTTRLETMHASVTNQIREQLEKSGPEDQPPLTNVVHDTKDQSASDRISQLDSAVDEMHRREIKDVEFALQRIVSGEYDCCVDCNDDIGLARLTASPTARRCIKCQTIYENTGATQNAANQSRVTSDEN